MGEKSVLTTQWLGYKKPLWWLCSGPARSRKKKSPLRMHPCSIQFIICFCGKVKHHELITGEKSQTWRILNLTKTFCGTWLVGVGDGRQSLFPKIKPDNTFRLVFNKWVLICTKIYWASTVGTFQNVYMTIGKMKWESIYIVHLSVHTHTHMPMRAEQNRNACKIDGCDLSHQFSILGICRPVSLISSGGPVFPSTGCEMVKLALYWALLGCQSVCLTSGSIFLWI